MPRISLFAQKIKDHLPTAAVVELSGMDHGDFSINYAEDYVKAIRLWRENK